MRVSELASIAGVSVRIIRHYHALGLMPIPNKSGAFRRYDFEDLALLIRIRSMVQAGMTLKDIEQQLATTTEPLFDQTLASIDQQIATLQRQRQKLIELKERSQSENRLTRPITEIYQQVEAILLANNANQALTIMRRERKLTELFMDLGFFSDDFDTTARRLPADDIAAFYLKLEKLHQPDWTMELCEELLEESFALWTHLAPYDSRTEHIARKFLTSKSAEKVVLAAFTNEGFRTFISMAMQRYRKEFKVLVGESQTGRITHSDKG